MLDSNSLGPLVVDTYTMTDEPIYVQDIET